MEETLYWLFVLSFYLVIFGFIFIAYYIYTSIVLHKIAEKLGYTDIWRAWVPIIKGGYQLELGNFNPWLYALIFIPIVGVITTTILGMIAWVRIAEKRKFPTWVGLLAAFGWLIPNGGMIVQGVVIGYMAWGEYKKE
jgi:hypothetical protein